MKIQSVQRAMDILSMFTLPHPTHGITEIAKAKSLNKATAWGLVTTMEQNGFLEQDPETRKYRLGPKIYELGMVYAGCLEINNKVSESAHSLAQCTRLTTRIGIWDRDAVLVSMVVEPFGQRSMSTQIGPRIDAYCTALGKATIAFLNPNELQDYLNRTDLISYTPSTITRKKTLIQDLKEVRRRGYAISDEELIPGAAGIAAPIFNRDGSLAAAMSLGATRKDYVLGERLDDLARDLMTTASEISQKMGFTPDAARKWA